MNDPLALVEQFVVNNTNCYVYPKPGCELVVVHIIVHSGSMADSESFDGTAHFLEHVITHSGSRAKNQIQDFFKDHGGFDYNSTNRSSTYYSFKVPLAQASEALEMYGEIILAGKIESQHLEIERPRIINEYKESFPYARSFNLLKETHNILSPSDSHWLGKCRAVIGSEQGIAKINLSTLLDFYEEHYNNNNISIVLSGDLSATEAFKLISASPFGTINKPGKNNSKLPALSEYSRPKINYIHEKFSSEEIQHGTLTSKFLIPRGLPGYTEEAIDIASSLIGATLRRHFIGNGLYKLGINLDDCCQDAIIGSINFNYLPIEMLSTVESKVTDCIKTAAEDLELFNTIKKRRINEVMLWDPNLERIADTINRALTSIGKITTAKEDVEAYKSASFQDLQSLIADYFCPENRLNILTTPKQFVP